MDRRLDQVGLEVFLQTLVLLAHDNILLQQVLGSQLLDPLPLSLDPLTPLSLGARLDRGPGLVGRGLVAKLALKQPDLQEELLDPSPEALGLGPLLLEEVV